jgi:hypothetical protein
VDDAEQPDWRLDPRPNPQLDAWFAQASGKQRGDHIGEVAFGPYERPLWQAFFGRNRGRMALRWLLRYDPRKFWVGPAREEVPDCRCPITLCGPDPPKCG